MGHTLPLSKLFLGHLDLLEQIEPLEQRIEGDVLGQRVNDLLQLVLRISQTPRPLLVLIERSDALRRSPRDFGSRSRTIADGNSILIQTGNFDKRPCQFS